MGEVQKKHGVYSRQEVVAQYNRFAEAKEEYQKVCWGSADAMQNRFLLAIERLPLSCMTSLLDAGCGTGMFLEMVHTAQAHLSLAGIDLSDRLIAYAREKLVGTNIQLRHGSFLDTTDRFDCIVCIGVLQKTTMQLADFFARAHYCLNPGGQVWVDTKHSGWRKYATGEAMPDPTHVHMTIEELREAAGGAGLIETEYFGFMPGENRTTESADAHTVIYRCSRA